MASCTKDNFDMDRLSHDVVYDGKFAVPLAYSDVTFAKVLDLIDNSLELRDNNEGYLSLYYESYVESKPVQNLLSVGDQSFTKTISLSDINSRGLRAESSLRYSTTENVSFVLFGDAEIDSIALKTATFEYSLNSTFGKTTRVVLEFPSIKKNGLPFKDSITLLSGDSHYEISIPLDEYTIDLTTTSQRFNEIPVRLSLVINFPSDDPPMSGDMTIDVGIKDIAYARMFGYFGYNELFFQSDTISIKLFKQNPKYYMERFYFNDPKLTVRYWNSYGVPSMFYFTELDTYVKTLDEVWDITSSSPDFPMSSTMPYEVKNATRYGEEALDSIAINKNNSNLDQIVPNRPQWIHFKALAATNPGTVGNHTHNNFITEDSKLKSKIEAEFPLWGYLYRFTYNDTVDIDLSEYIDDYPVNRMALLITLENRMPVNTYAQFYLVDETLTVLDSLIDNPDRLVLKPAPVDANGRIINPEKTQTRVELTRTQVEKMLNAKYIIISLHASTDDALQGRLMKIYREYGVKANVGLEFDLDIDGNIDSVVNAITSNINVSNSNEEE